MHSTQGWSPPQYCAMSARAIDPNPAAASSAGNSQGLRNTASIARRWAFRAELAS
jgi:hypothetical protein